MGRFTLLYVVVLAIPLLIGSLALWRGLAQLRDDLLATNISVLELNQQLLSAELDRFQELAIRIDRSTELRRLYNQAGPVEGPIPAWLLDAWQETYDHVLLDATLAEVVIYVRDLATVFTSRDIYLNLDVFLADDFFSYGALDRPNLVSTLLTPPSARQTLPAAPLSYRDMEISGVVVQQTLPLDDPLRAEATLLVILNGDSLARRLSTTIVDQTGFAAIIADDGTVVVAVTPDGESMPDIEGGIDGEQGAFATRVRGTQYTVAYVRDSDFGLVHVVLVPTRIYLQQATRLQIVVIVAALVAIVIGLVVSFLFAYRTGKPIAELEDILLQSAPAPRDGVPVFDFLSQSVERLVESNSELNAAIRVQRPLAAMAAVERLMRGEYVDDNAAEEALREVGIQSFDRRYAAILVVGHYRHSDADLAARKALVRTTIGRVSAGWPILDLGDDELVFVGFSGAGTDEKSKAEFMRLGQAVIKEIEGRYRAGARVFVGNIVAQLVDLPASLVSARVARAHSLVTGTARVESADALPMQSDHLYYPISIESQLIAAAVAGDTERTNTLLETVIGENYKRRALPEQEVGWLYSELKGTALRAMEYMRDRNQRTIIASSIEGTLMDTSEESLLVRSKAIFRSIAAWFSDQRGSHHSDLKRKMEQYVSDTLLDRRLSLTGMADHAGVSEAYASSMFKEIMGENFGAYVERERLEYAQRLLVEGRYTIEQIAARVGYNSATSFRRAFKRRFGVPPSTGRRSDA